MVINVHCPGEHYTWAVDLNNEALYTLLASAPELAELRYKLRNYRIGTLILILKLDKLSPICIYEWIKDLQKMLELLKIFGISTPIVHWRYTISKTAIQQLLKEIEEFI